MADAPVDPSELGRRERKKLEVRRQLADQALALFAERGYDAVSVEDITEAADVSRTTFFRHYPNKEDVLVQWMRSIGDEAAHALVERPAEEVPVVALRESIMALAAAYGGDRERAELIERLRRESASVQSAYRDKLAYWENAITRALAMRSGLDADTALYPRLTARLAMAAISSASDTWLAGGRRGTVADSLDRAFRVLDQAALQDLLDAERRDS